MLPLLFGLAATVPHVFVVPSQPAFEAPVACNPTGKFGICGNLLDDAHSKCMSWYWNWGAGSQNVGPMEFVPTKFSQWWPGNDEVTSHSSEFILTWNEPNHGEQTSIDPNAEYIWDSWKDMYRSAKAGGKKIGSPQIANCGGNCVPQDTVGDGVSTWMTPFFKGICGSNCTNNQFNQQCCEYFPDFITVHIYYSSVDEAIWRLEEYKRQFPGVPIWVSEFGFNREPESEQQGLSNIMDFVRYMEADSQVFRASWYIYGYGGSERHRAFNSMYNNGVLTAVGRAYLGLS